MEDKQVIYPGFLNGMVQMPPSKSLSHRAIIAAALAEGHSRISHIVYSEDIDATLGAMEMLGAAVYRESGAVSISGIGRRSASDGEAVDLGHKSLGRVIQCGESGSTLRFMIPIATALYEHLCFEGKGRLVTRPIEAYFPIFEASGMAYTHEGILPLKTSGRMKAGSYVIQGNVSSQYVTGMLMAAPLFEGDTEIVIEGELESKGYVDLTLDILNTFSICYRQKEHRAFWIPGNQIYQAKDYRVEGDYSQSIFWIAAGILGGRVALSGLPKASRQGDRKVVDLVQAMGGKLSYDEENQIWIASKSQTVGARIDASEIPDLVPGLAALAAYSQGETVIFNGDRLRIKESDRIKTTVDILSRMGADIRETGDGMVIRGKAMLEGGVSVQGHGDHRIVMAATIAAAHCRNPVVIEGCSAVRKSYPHFFDDFVKLGGRIGHPQR